MTLILDAGAFLSVERGERDLVAVIKAELVAMRTPVTHGGVVGQVWRGGAGRQGPIARLLPAVDIVALDESLGRQAGVLLAVARSTDVVDAALMLLCADGDTVVTSDVDDMAHLANSAGHHVELLAV